MVFVSGTRILHRVILQTTTALIAQCQPANFYMYPHAAQDVIMVQGTLGVKEGQLSIYFHSGQRILRVDKLNKSLDISYLADGVYDLIFQTHKQTSVLQMVKGYYNLRFPSPDHLTQGSTPRTDS